jgi:hypothetical protein
MICHIDIGRGDRVIHFRGESNSYHSVRGVQWTSHYICTDFVACTKRRVELDLRIAEERLAKEKAEEEAAARKEATVEAWVKE